MSRSNDDRKRPKNVVWVDDDPRMHVTTSDQGETFSIGDLARDFDVSLRTLRFYENKGLLSPRRDGMMRTYTVQDRARLAAILQGKRLGFTLAEIQDMVAAGQSVASLNLTREKCLEQIKLLERQKRDVEGALAELRRIYSSFYTSSSDSDVTGE